MPGMRLAPSVPDPSTLCWVPIGASRVTVKQWHGSGYRNLSCYQGFARRGRETERCGHTHFHMKRAKLCATTLANYLNREQAR